MSNSEAHTAAEHTCDQFLCHAITNLAAIS
jgi:hypothetical protein